MTTTYTPGSDIKLTVTETPKTEAAEDTIRRLMRMNTEMQRELNKANRHREKTTIVRIRHGNVWHQRQRVPKRVHAVKGESWTMKYRPQLAGDLASVSKYLSIEPV